MSKPATRLFHQATYGPLTAKTLQTILRRELMEQFGFEHMGLIAEALIKRFLEILDAFSPDRVRVKVPATSELCGIATPGTLEFAPQKISLSFQPAAEGKQLEATVDCLFAEERKIKGQFDIKANVSAEGEAEELLKALAGDFEYYAQDGSY